jgi:kynurenine formamidase
LSADESMKDLVRLISQAKVYDLEQVRYSGMPYFPTQAPGYYYFLHRRHGDSQGGHPHGGGVTGTSGLLTSADHMGTHVDALCHMAKGGRLYDGTEVTGEIESRQGYKKGGAEEIPALILPGVMLDIPALKGVEVLPEGYEITTKDIEDCCNRQKVKIEPGSAVLVRTGFGKLWMDSSRYLRAAGLSREASKLMGDKGVKVLGADNVGVDPTIPPAPGKDRSHYAHEYCLAEKGAYLLEIMNLEPLADDKCYEFLLICLPLKMQGATAGWVRPVAVSTAGKRKR